MEFWIYMTLLFFNPSKARQRWQSIGYHPVKTEIQGRPAGLVGFAMRNGHPIKRVSL
jgi:hypothetical protein